MRVFETDGLGFLLRLSRRTIRSSGRDARRRIIFHARMSRREFDELAVRLILYQAMDITVLLSRASSRKI